MGVFWLIALFVLGACIGSFLNVLIYRLPRGESIVFPGSHCPSCGRPIRWYDNIPILSWLLLRGRCHSCNARISPRYLLIEIATAVLVSGLYACYFLLDVRDGAGQFVDAWPMFAAHAALLCGLLVCSAVDIEVWLIPLEVMWVCSILGVGLAAFRPHGFMPAISADMAGIGFAAALGLLVAVLLQRAGVIQVSFLDAEEPPSGPNMAQPKSSAGKGKSKGPSSGKADRPRPRSVAITAEHGVSPRREILHEVVFLTPAIVLSIGTGLLLRYVPAVGDVWRGLLDPKVHGELAPRLLSGGSALLGYLVGGLWIWGMRILGTLAFGKEAMGLGDVHILAAVGAATGWVVPSIAFFVAPFFGLAWALYLWATRGQRELPYGPWLALGSVVVMLFYDALAGFLRPYAETIRWLAGG